MVKLQMEQVANYLSQRLQAQVEVLQLARLGDENFSPMLSPLATMNRQEVGHRTERQALKTFGYGEPVLVDCRVDGKATKLVLRTVAVNQFDHQTRADRAAELLLDYDTFNQLPNHAHALDVGVVTSDDRLLSLAKGDEFFLLTEYVSGTPYARDLQRLRDTGEATGADLMRARQLAIYLANIHSQRGDDASLYTRRVRETVGSGKGIMGLIDSYEQNAFVDRAWLAELEQTCVTWRWRLKDKTHRLTQVHGDFHPYNVIFARDGSFQLLNRSRGAWGEPADDLVCMAINYLFFSLQRSGKLAAPFEQLWNIFWNTYLSLRSDAELLTVVAPFFAWRALVLASPLWYNVTDSVRYALLSAARAILQTDLFDPVQMNTYLKLEEDFATA